MKNKFSLKTKRKTLPGHYKDTIKQVHKITPNKGEARISRRWSETLNVECRGGNHSEPLVAQMVLSARTAPQSGQTTTGGPNSGKEGRIFIYLLLDSDPEDENCPQSWHTVLKQK